MLDPDFHANAADYGHAAGIFAALARGQAKQIEQQAKNCRERQARIDALKNRTRSRLDELTLGEL